MIPSLTESCWSADKSLDVSDISVGGLLRQASEDAPETIALVEVAPPGRPSLTGAGRTDRAWTYQELSAAATRCAGWLLERFRPGERITVWAPNVPEWIILEYGAALAGLVLVTANPALRPAELGYVIGQSGSAGVFFVDSFRETAMADIARSVADATPGVRHAISFSGWYDELSGESGSCRRLPPVSPDDPAQIQYTSGTSGFPKGALLHHRGLVSNALFVARRLGIADGATWVSAVPLFHTGGCGMSILGCANTRGTYGLCQYFDPRLVLTALQDMRADVAVAVPTMLLAMLEQPDFATFDLSQCALSISGGTTVPPELVRRVEREFGVKLVIVYGQTEIGAIATATSPEDDPEDRETTVGRPLWQVEVRVVDSHTGSTVPVGEQGEIWFRGYQCMLRYYDMPAETAAVMRPDGWLRTGDLGSLDERGYCRVTGRIKDMIIRGGENIYPREIEELLARHMSIAEAVVVGVPDDKWGEQVAAVLQVADPGESPAVAELRSYCRAHLAPHKTPRYWYVMPEFPFTASGKVRKFQIRELIIAGAVPLLPETSG